MNISTTFVFPSKEDPKIIAIISIWSDGKYFRAELLSATYLGEGRSRLSAQGISPIREDYFDTMTLCMERVPDEFGYRAQYGAAIARLKSLIIEQKDIISYDGASWDPVAIGNESAIDGYGVPGLKRMIVSNSKNPELKRHCS